MRLTIDASYDDGRGWHSAPVRRSATGCIAELDHPGNGFVSLRAEAADVIGNRVEQTTVHGQATEWSLSIDGSVALGVDTFRRTG